MYTKIEFKFFINIFYKLKTNAYETNFSSVGISYDDHYSFRLHSPSITVVEQPINTIAVKAVDLLMNQITNENDAVVEKVLQKGKLVIRESV